MLLICLKIHSHCNFITDVQWEGNCQYIHATLKDFILWKDDEKNCGPFAHYSIEDFWAYADYMYAKDMFSSVSSYDIFKEVNWSNLGFSESEGQDMAVWIGSKGAHTVCHYDTYGYNLVFQVGLFCIRNGNHCNLIFFKIVLDRGQ